VKLKITKALVTSVATSVGILGVSAGVVFGVSAGMYRVSYMDLESMDARLNAAKTQNCYSQNVISKWNMRDELNPNEQVITETKWKEVHGDGVPLPNLTKDGKDPGWSKKVDESEMHRRWKFATMCIDGSTHSTLDRSFNESLYRGIISFIQGRDVTEELSGDSTVEPSTLSGNYTAASFKPAEDNNNGLTSTYKAIAAETDHRILGLAGFNHVSPLGDLGTVDEHGVFQFGTQFQALKNMLMLLIDGNVPNNQAVSSVLFRADQPGFLTAIATAMYFYNNLHIYHKGYKELSMGLYGGNPIPTVTIYMGGAQRGVEFFNHYVLSMGLLDHEFGIINSEPVPSERIKLLEEVYIDLKKLLDYSKHKDDIYAYLNNQQSKYTKFDDIKADLYDEYKIRVIKLGQYGTHFTGSFASGDAIGITKQYLTRGASAIMAVAGPQSLDSAQEIQNQGSECIVVGVDTAMENGSYQRKHTSGGLEDKSIAPDQSKPSHKDNIIKFSAIKDIATVTKKFCELSIQGKNFDVASSTDAGQPDPAKAICGVGYQTCGNILNGLISISFDGWHPFIQAMRHIVIRDGQGSFEDSWTTQAIAYVDTVDIPQTVKVNLKDISKLDTYNKKLQIGDDQSDTVEKYYPHMTAILGKILSEIELDFYGRTVINDNGVIREPKDKAEGRMSILNWLTNNMYFTS